MHPRGLIPALRQLRTEIRQTIQGPWFLVLGIAVPLLAYVGYRTSGIGGATGRSIGGITWPSYFMVSMAAFGAISVAVGSAAAPVRRLRSAAAAGAGRAGTASIGSSAVVRITTAVILALPPVVVLGLAGALDGVHLSGARWAAFIAVLWLGSLPFVALGLLLAPMLDAEVRDIAVLGALTVLAILGGLFQPVATLPSGLAALAHVLPSYHLADLGWTVIAVDAVDPVDVFVLVGYTVAIGVAVWLKRSEGGRVGDSGDTDGGATGRRRSRRDPPP